MKCLFMSIVHKFLMEDCPTLIRRRNCVYGLFHVSGKTSDLGFIIIPRALFSNCSLSNSWERMRRLVFNVIIFYTKIITFNKMIPFLITGKEFSHRRNTVSKINTSYDFLYKWSFLEFIHFKVYFGSFQYDDFIIILFTLYVITKFKIVYIYRITAEEKIGYILRSTILLISRVHQTRS